MGLDFASDKLMFVIGMDPEMIAAALEEAYCKIIARLPSYSRRLSIGWRFLDKFVQLPFPIPPNDYDDVDEYVKTLFYSTKIDKSNLS